MEEITGRKIPCYSVDLLNREALKEVFTKVSCNHDETISTTGTILYKQCCSKVRFIGGQSRVPKVQAARGSGGML